MHPPSRQSDPSPKRNDIRRLQDYLRLRADHVGQAGSCVQLMQKALERMNVKLHDAISSLAGASGMAVMRAILTNAPLLRPCVVVDTLSA